MCIFDSFLLPCVMHAPPKCETRMKKSVKSDFNACWQSFTFLLAIQFQYIDFQPWRSVRLIDTIFYCSGLCTFTSKVCEKYGNTHTHTYTYIYLYLCEICALCHFLHSCTAGQRAISIICIKLEIENTKTHTHRKN